MCVETNAFYFHSSLASDYYIGLKEGHWVNGEAISWTNFVEPLSDGMVGVLNISEMFKWDTNDGTERLNFICEKVTAQLISM